VIPAGVEIYVALEPVDMRLSFDRLSGLAKERVGYEARCGALFIFFGRRRDALKVLFFDGSGMVIFYNQPSSHYTSFDRI
jgi:transposase